MRGRGTSCLVRDSAPEFENSRKCWRLYSDLTESYHKKKKDFDTNLKGFSQIDNGVLTKGNSRLKEVQTRNDLNVNLFLL